MQATDSDLMPPKGGQAGADETERERQQHGRERDGARPQGARAYSGRDGVDHAGSDSSLREGDTEGERERYDDEPEPEPCERPRIMGLDVGSVRIGVAISCPFGRMASPLCVLSRSKKPFVEIARLCREREVSRLVVGRPLRLSGEDGPAVAHIEGFVRRLQQDVAIEVAWVDERLTTRAAERSMLAHGASRKTRRAHIDEVAAALLLQTYLDGARLTV